MHAALHQKFPAALLVLTLLTTTGRSELRADSKAAPMPERAVPKYPAGPVRGTLLIGGGVGDSKEIVEGFLALAGGEKAEVVVATLADKGDKPLHPEAWWRQHPTARVRVLAAKGRADAENLEFLERLRKSTGVWFDNDSVRELVAVYGAPLFVQELKALLDRDGVVAGDLAGAQVLTQLGLVAGPKDSELDIVSGFGLLPNSIVATSETDSSPKNGVRPRLAETMKRYPGRVGFDILPKSALVVRGRNLASIGASVEIVLAASEKRPENVIRLRPFMREDLTALSRAAIARTQPTFPAEAAAKPLVPKGSLVIVGGGGMPADVTKKFIELSGGEGKAVIAVIPTAGENPIGDVGDIGWLTKAGAKKVVTIHARTRAEANSPEIVAKLRECGGVWFGGGRQWRFVDAYEGTACYDEFHAVLARGGAIGGSSAGATIQGEYLVRGSPIVNTIMMCEGYERGFGFLQGAAIDQHFTQRGRLPDMQNVMKTHPQLFGLGIDEGTAIVVQGSEFEVLGQAAVSVFPPTPKDAQVPDIHNPQSLKAGEKYDLKKFMPVRRKL
jgi:cyanophycinase